MRCRPILVGGNLHPHLRVLHQVFKPQRVTGRSTLRGDQHQVSAISAINQCTAIPRSGLSALGGQQHAGDAVPIVSFGAISLDVALNMLAHPFRGAVDDGRRRNAVLGDRLAHT